VGGVVGTSVALTLPLGSSPGVTLDVLSGVVCGMIAAPTAIGFPERVRRTRRDADERRLRSRHLRAIAAVVMGALVAACQSSPSAHPSPP
jgi:hypothetical protein